MSIKISDLTLASAAESLMELEVNDSLVSKKVTINQIDTHISSTTQTLTNKTIDGDNNTLQNIDTPALKTKTGLDASVVTGTAGTDGNFALWNADGDIVDGAVYDSGTYTPVWSADTTNPSIGNGILEGRYTKIGTLVNMSIKIVMGSTTTFGSGSYSFGLPFQADNDSFLNGVRVLGLDVGTAYRFGTMIPAGGGFAVRVLNDSTFTAWNPTNPHTWANTDEITINLTYKAVS